MNLEFLLRKYRFIYNKCGYKKPTVVFAMPEMGKTTSALHYCETKPNCIYFTFANTDSDFALKIFCENNREIFASCLSWSDFFDKLEILAKEKRLTVFFDNAGERNDKKDFYEALDLFLNKKTKTAVIFLCNPWEKIDILCDEIKVDSITLKEIADHFNIADKEAAEIYLLTGGIASILSEYDINLPFEENVKAFLNNKSAFYNYTLNCMCRCFRSPESYNTLLYAISNGYNRISEISAFCGQPKNKCDKYIKSLIEYGFVKTEIGKNGYTKYYPSNSYICLWYKILFATIPNADGTFDDNTYERFIEYFNEILVPDFYKKLCDNWVKTNYSNLFLTNKDNDFAKHSDIIIDDVTFGFVCKKNGKNYYFYYNNVFGDSLNKTLVDKVEEITTRDTPFYDNEYFFLSVNRIPDSLEKLAQKYDNIHFVRLGVIFTAYKDRKNRKYFRM